MATMVQLNKKKKRGSGDVLLDPRPDRRLLANVPDENGERTNIDRRGLYAEHAESAKSFHKYVLKNKAGIRYRVDIQVQVRCRMPDGSRRKLTARGVDLSTTGMLLLFSDEQDAKTLQNAGKVRLKFRIKPGAMPEGLEMRVDIGAELVRNFSDQEGCFFCGVAFAQDLGRYAAQHKDKNALAVSSLLLFFIVSFIMLMRAESIIYFKFNKVLYLYSIITAAFLLSRYLFGSFYRAAPVNMDFTPGVTIIIPCFNEEEWIQRTIVSCMNQDYPIDKLEVIVVDDCSNDRSVEKIKEIVDKLYQEEARFKTAERLAYFVQPQNQGKRHALARGVMEAKHELVVFVDSDSFLDPYAIRNLVMPFQDPKMGGVSGRTDVANTYTNTLTKMQAVRYYIAFRIMKAAEAVFDAVTCLSGPLSCYRKEFVMESMNAWLNQKFLGRKATFGDDRSMTNFLLRKYRTGYQDTAICSTIVPNKYKTFLAQQMRWKRSWLRESIIAGSFMWKKEPFVAILFYIGLLVPLAAPVVVVYNLLYVPIFHRVFPTTFLLGMLMMALLMSIAQLLLKKSSTWVFGMLFCIFYESVLLWQMPVAWFTFWKSTWGTRRTPEDIASEQRKRRHKRRKIRKTEASLEEEEDEFEDAGASFVHKDRNKRFRGVLQVAVVLVVSYFLVVALFTTSRYQPYGVVPENSPDNGFIAVSYFGVDRNGTRSLISTKRLEQHLKALHDSGYVTITQQDILDYYAGEKLLPPKALLLLFEDGRRDTGIFSEKIMEKYNDIATMFSYADKFAEMDPKFLSPSDLKNLVDSTFWELGTNGYRLEFINVFDRYNNYLGELDSLEFSMVAPYLHRKYDHYLMDYIRDKDGIPKESLEEMRERITGDYQLMDETYQKELGVLPRFYALMHSNTGQFGTNEKASSVNADNIYRLFSMNINREGFSLNNKKNSVYDLTRLQPQPYWSTNHLLMKLQDDTGQEMSFITGDQQRASFWTVLDGKAEFDKNKVIVTSMPRGTGKVRLNDSEKYKDLSVSMQLHGNALGAQSVLLRTDETMQNYIQVAVQDKKLVITQMYGGEAKQVYSERLDILNGDPRVSVPEDQLETEIGTLQMRLRYADNADEAVDTAGELSDAGLQEAESVEEGAEEYVPQAELNEPQSKALTISMAGKKLSVQVDGVAAVKDLRVRCKSSGSVVLESRTSMQEYSQRNLMDDVYDGVFEDLVVSNGKETILFDGRLKKLERVLDVAAEKWNRLVNWFVQTL